MRLRRQHLVWIFVALAVPLILASAAFACTSLATLNLSSSTYEAGSDTTTTITGTGFNRSRGPVEIHIDSRDGRPLTSVAPDEHGHFRATVVVPGTISVGYHFFLATETTVEETQRAEPVRASFQVLPARASGSAAPSGPGHPHEADHPSDRHEVHPGTNQSALVVALGSPVGLAALALSGVGGLVLSRRRIRKDRVDQSPDGG